MAIHHGDDTIHTGDTGCSMHHTEDRTITEGLPQGSLDALIRTLVNIRCCLIEHQDARRRQHRPRQSHQLRLTHGEMNLLATKLSPSQSSSGASQPSHVSVATPNSPPPASTTTSQISFESGGSASELVTVVRAAFRKVLGDQPMENQSNFFTFGGDPISAIRCCTALRTSRFTVKVRDIYENPTVAGLAALLAQRDPKPEQQSPSHVSNACLLRKTPIEEWLFPLRSC
ncbi:unnamed protein product [Penicillium glandicola]